MTGPARSRPCSAAGRGGHQGGSRLTRRWRNCWKRMALRFSCDFAEEPQDRADRISRFQNRLRPRRDRVRPRSSRMPVPSSWFAPPCRRSRCRGRIAAFVSASSRIIHRYLRGPSCPGPLFIPCCTAFTGLTPGVRAQENPDLQERTQENRSRRFYDLRYFISDMHPRTRMTTRRKGSTSARNEASTP